MDPREPAVPAVKTFLRYVIEAVTILLVIWAFVSVILLASTRSIDGTPVAATVAGCDVTLSGPDGPVDIAKVGDDGWMTEDVEGGSVIVSGLSSGTWTATYSDGSIDTFTVDCPEPDASQDPSEVDICQWAAPDEIIEGCALDIESVEGGIGEPITAMKTLPPTDTAP